MKYCPIFYFSLVRFKGRRSAFGEEFNVDLGKFPIGDYFSDEDDSILPAITKFLLNRTNKKTKALTVGHLEKEFDPVA